MTRFAGEPIKASITLPSPDSVLARDESKLRDFREQHASSDCLGVRFHRHHDSPGFRSLVIASQLLGAANIRCNFRKCIYLGSGRSPGYKHSVRDSEHSPWRFVESCWAIDDYHLVLLVKHRSKLHYFRGLIFVVPLNSWAVSSSQVEHCCCQSASIIATS